MISFMLYAEITADLSIINLKVNTALYVIGTQICRETGFIIFPAYRTTYYQGKPLFRLALVRYWR